MSAIDDKDADTSGIPHADKLTFVDKLKAQFHPLVNRNSMSGQIEYPRREYLSNVAQSRDEEGKTLEQKAAERAKGSR